MKYILSLLLLLSTPAFAEDTAASKNFALINGLNICTNFAVNYTLFVVNAHNATKEQFDKWIEVQVADQDHASTHVKIRIRALGDAAWKDRDANPAEVAMTLYMECESQALKHFAPQN